ncbi:MAG: hypothetical protein HEQ12_13370 [Aphanizomenon flos-aquae DEX188]|nr:hypothetical protein [Nostocales cyanobacterium W4_Combined_metabat2_030]QSV65510.1 MAG: hypothetical protein HEQ12_13370 [Aphanizomenon flos-aquae DEX188]
MDLKLKSKQLLEIAKIGVEKAIETDEATATDWINQQLAILGIDTEVLNVKKSLIKIAQNMLNFGRRIKIF